MTQAKRNYLLLAMLATVAILPVASIPRAFALGEYYQHKDWNLRFYNNTGFPETEGEKKNVQWMHQHNKTFLRFSLFPRQTGNADIDRLPSKGAPYWERADIKQTDTLKTNAKYRLSFDLRFVKGMTSARETYWQLRVNNKNCTSKALLMLQVSKGRFILSALKRTGSASRSPAKDKPAKESTANDDTTKGEHDLKTLRKQWAQRDTQETQSQNSRVHVKNSRTKVRIRHKKVYLNPDKQPEIDIWYGTWLKYRIDVTMNGTRGHASVTINGTRRAHEISFHIPKCATPYTKVGLYRPGSQSSGNEASVVDFMNISSKKLK